MSRESPPNIERHYTTRETAQIIGGTSGHLRNLRIKNKGPRWVVTADGVIRYPESAIREWLSGTKRRAA